MMEHPRSGCTGAPEAVVVSVGHNPNPNSARVSSSDSQQAPSLAEALAQSPAPNLFPAIHRSLHNPGISGSAFAAQLAKLPAPVTVPSMRPMQVDDQADNSITGKKRSAAVALVQYSKRKRTDVVPPPIASVVLDFEPELALKTTNGVILVSPAKKAKVGRPPGRKNNPKPTSLKPRKLITEASKPRQKRTFKAIELSPSFGEGRMEAVPEATPKNVEAIPSSSNAPDPKDSTLKSALE